MMAQRHSKAAAIYGLVMAQSYFKTVLLIEWVGPMPDAAGNLLSAQNFSQAVLSKASSWPISSLKRQSQWNGIGPALFQTGVTNSMMAQRSCYLWPRDGPELFQNSAAN